MNRTAVFTARPSISATASDKIFNYVNIFLMLIIGVVTLYPFWYCVILSLNEGLDSARAPLYLWPRVFTLENYHFILTNDRTLHGAFISVSRTLLGTLLSVLFTGVVSYGLSKKWLMGRKFYMLIFVFTMYFSGGLIPYYLLMRNIGFLDNFLIYIIPSMFGFYNAILMMAYYESIPSELEESARIDGAGHFYIFISIILPTSMPIFATIALYCGVAQWNSWFDTLIYTRSPNLITLQAIMSKMIHSAEAVKEMNEQMAASGAVDGFQTISPITIRVATMVFTTLPITLIYPFLQKYFVKGIMLGSVKG